MRTLGAWGLLAAILFTGACSDSSATTTSGPDQPPATDATTTSTAVINTTTFPEIDTTTTTEAIEILLPANDVDDPTEAIVAIFEYVDYLAANPSLAKNLLGMVYAETCECHDRLLVDFDSYLMNGWAQDDQGSSDLEGLRHTTV